MNDQIKNKLLKILKTIAPEIDAQEIETDEDLRDQVDLDSMDWLKYITKVGKEFNCEIPENDYTKLVNLDDFVSYLTNSR
ncbi:acyl carrier protein [Halobacteriovorax sp. GFR7]|uniref:acyl carrier protein n=1 Tax=unclassified Halobacteriovorax TaxID=2639665 RepID=UPI003D99572A